MCRLINQVISNINNNLKKYQAAIKRLFLPVNLPDKIPGQITLIGQIDALSA